MMNDFFKKYQMAENQLREECDAMVEDDEYDQDFADFRFFMARDEILEAMINMEMEEYMDEY